MMSSSMSKIILQSALISFLIWQTLADSSCTIVCSRSVEYCGLSCTCELCSVIAVHCSNASQDQYYEVKCKKIKASGYCTDLFSGSLAKEVTENATTSKPIVIQKNMITEKANNSANNANYVLYFAIGVPVLILILFVLIVIIIWRKCRSGDHKHRKAQAADVELGLVESAGHEDVATPLMQSSELKVSNAESNAETQLQSSRDQDRPPDEQHSTASRPASGSHDPDHDPIVSFAQVHVEPIATSASQQVLLDDAAHASPARTDAARSASGTPDYRQMTRSSSTGAACANDGTISPGCDEAQGTNSGNVSRESSSLDFSTEELASRSDGEVAPRSNRYVQDRHGSSGNNLTGSAVREFSHNVGADSTIYGLPQYPVSPVVTSPAEPPLFSREAHV